ncbi:unnamed protein product (macronuclear) [Paramecium tetraurelia]|uniref:GOLD domain-containing protein n=1 Tax=Paramecium tetraurelia TaxID=5888 RepID=A0D2K7_PARTE|nr:uncharacterized protein GSPATT00012782001 [Paramecium tetraurelia]CAK77274.1 unnamed protein product [Paramecium tetraurelia]|eukprot:XP_001444671.1 hypothetical protein (macronuclear) [Paramecium tetraurelia strain d4-2]
MISIIFLLFGLIQGQDDDVINYVEEDKQDRKDLMQEWELMMQDFIPDDMIAFELKQGNMEILEEGIHHPTTIRGAYFISMTTKEKINFLIKDPKGNIISSKAAKKEAVFSVNITEPGDYQFLFDNERGSSDQIVTFALDIHNATYEHIKHHDLDPLMKQIQHLQNGINDIMFETKFSQQRRESGYESMQSTHSRLFYFSIFETIIIILVSVWQVYYIKSIIDNRRLI